MKKRINWYNVIYLLTAIVSIIGYFTSGEIVVTESQVYHITNSGWAFIAGISIGVYGANRFAR